VDEFSKIEADSNKNVLDSKTNEEEVEAEEKVNHIVALAQTEYECPCSAVVKPGTELHLCKNCGAAQCPNCFDYDSPLCEECISKTNNEKVKEEKANEQVDSFPIMFYDLSQKCQEALLKFMGTEDAQEMNWDVIPVAEIPRLGN